jgi:hypothetical protein
MSDNSVCDRCGHLYLANVFPHRLSLCPVCILGDMPVEEREKLLVHLAKTGQPV